MTTGYPRFFIHKSIEALAAVVASSFARTPGQRAMMFPNKAIAQRCVDFFHAKTPPELLEGLDTVNLVLDTSNPDVIGGPLLPIRPTISAVLFHPNVFSYAKQYWQHSGDGVSSRRAEFCNNLLTQGLLVPDVSLTTRPKSKGPRRYQQRTKSFDEACKASSTPAHGNPSPAPDSEDSVRFVEERFGRNLDLSLAQQAKTAMRRRIAGTLAHNVNIDLGKDLLPERAEPSSRGLVAQHGLTEDDIYLYPNGINAIFNTHRLLMSARGRDLKSISFGFPYVDTLKILQKFGPGCIFYGFASEEELDDLERRLESGERYLGLFCEFPGNPILTCPNLRRIRSRKYQIPLQMVGS